MKEFNLYEIDYSCSPGGVNCWEITDSKDNFIAGDFTRAESALAYLLQEYPLEELSLNIRSLQWYFVNSIKMG